MRPGSIRLFQWCYPAFLVATLLTAWLSWPQQQQQLTAFAVQLNTDVGLLTRMTVITGVLIRSLLLLLWWLVAWRHSVVAKWAIVVLFVLYLSLQVPTLLGGGHIGPVTMSAMALNAVSVWLLFRPDAEDWFWSDEVSEEESLPPEHDV